MRQRIMVSALIIFLLIITLNFNTSIPMKGVESGVQTMIEAMEKSGLNAWVTDGCGSYYDRNEVVNIHIKSDRDGYLTVINFTADGSVLLMYPNKYHQDNYIQRNQKYRIPAIGDPFKLRAGQEGEELVFAIVTEEKHPLINQEYSFSTQIMPVLQGSQTSIARNLHDTLENLSPSTWYAANSCSFCVGRPCPSRALVIGINEYATPANRLKYCVDDAKSMKSILQKRFAHIKILTDTQATYRDIKEGFSWLKQADKDEPVVIYYSGHGYHKQDADGDEEDGYDETIVSQDEKLIIDDMIAKWLSEIPSTKKVLMLDSCYSGGGEKNVKSLTPRFGEKAFVNLSDNIAQDFSKPGVKGTSNENVLALEASQPNEFSLEYPSLGHGVFTYYLLQAFRGGADQNEDYSVSAQEAFRYAKEKVENWTKDKQHPMLSGNLNLDIEISSAE